MRVRLPVPAPWLLRGFWCVPLLLLAGGLCSCQREGAPARQASPAPTPIPTPVPTPAARGDATGGRAGLRPVLAVREGLGLLFTYFDHRAEMRTVEQVASVEAAARSLVMVTDPKSRPPGDQVYVADLRKVEGPHGYRVWMEPRSAWLDRAMPKLSELKKQAALAEAQRPKKPRKRRKPRATAAAGTAAGGTAGGAAAGAQAKPKAVIFTTAWCPSCKSAKAYFAQRGIPFLELDVEKNPEAAQQYAAIQQRYRLRQGVVPLIVINGRVFQGFSAQQVEAALAQPPPS
ncbi:MAG: hypothetical protein IT371_27020 [Deltaproteobacteria bacterium]|nr:hypothetical protein [Deltaproteobacteria bacterium]